MLRGMIRRFSPWILPGLMLLAGPACHREPPPPKAVVVSKGVPKLVGTIFMVNEDGRFVLVKSDAWSGPDEGTALKCMRDGKETGIVNVGKERRAAYVTADIVTGHPKRGDEVFK